MSTLDSTLDLEAVRETVRGDAALAAMNRFDGENFVALFDMIAEGAYCVDRERRILHWNKAAERITGYRAEEVVGTCCHDNLLKHIDEFGSELCAYADLCPLHLSMLDGKVRMERVSLLHKDGRRIPVSVKTMPIRGRTGQTLGALELFSAPRVNRLRQDLADAGRMAYTDGLTGLPNRRFINIQLEQALEEWNRRGWPFACVIADIDYFGNINDIFGRESGDQAINVVLNTMALACGEADMLGRWGGDEAVGIVKNVGEADLDDILARMLDLVRHTRIGSALSSLTATISAGATLARKGDTAKSVLRRADDGLYQSKLYGRDRYVIV